MALESTETSTTVLFGPRTCSIASFAALEETGREYTAVRVSMTPDGAGDDTFIGMNPRRHVPVLMVGGQVIRETSAIMRFLDDVHPEANLLPQKGSEAITATEWLGYLGGSIHPAFRTIFRPGRFVEDDPGAIAMLRARTTKTIKHLLSRLGDDIGDRDWMLSRRSGIDFYLFVFVRWARLLDIRVPKNPADHFSRVGALPAMA